MKHIREYWTFIVIIFFFSMFLKPAICMLIIGSLALYLGISAVCFLKNIKNRGIEGMGRILSYQTGFRGHKTPIIKFTPSVGEPVIAEPFVYASSDFSKIRSYKELIDTEVTILYDPEDPKKFVLAGEEGYNNIAFTMLILVGLFLIGFSFYNY